MSSGRANSTICSATTLSSTPPAKSRWCSLDRVGISSFHPLCSAGIGPARGPSPRHRNGLDVESGDDLPDVLLDGGFVAGEDEPPAVHRVVAAAGLHHLAR